MSRSLLLVGVGSTAAGGEVNLARIAASRPIVLVGPTAPTWAPPYLPHHTTASESGTGDRLASWVVVGSSPSNWHATLDEMARHLSIDVAAPTVDSRAAQMTDVEGLDDAA
ncbi:hypothetical protein [Streptomyces dangxiongensis]|uniref:hypothetical protein n=1 Tax=Streptomyces dangxiongensis TaxID=1442032 RepID=UPI0013CEAAF0|nr:hypothetical protein [Streptomyces dangxiongensis]